MNVSEHCKERYVERIKEIRDPKEIKQYLVQNGDRITENIKKMHEYSTFIYKGQIGQDKITRHFYIKDDTIFVVDTACTCIITLYKIDFGFPDETTKMVVKDLMKEVDAINMQIDGEKIALDTFVEEKTHEIENIDEEIKTLESQIAHLKFKKQLAADEITAKRGDVQMLTKKVEHYATLLCNSLAFRNDVMKNMK